jgi:hypothetical protein
MEATTMSGLYASRPAQTHAFGKEVLFQAPNEPPVLIPQALARALEHTRSFAELEEHARRVSQRLGGSDADARGLLDELVQSGLLVSLADVCDGAREAPRQAPLERIAVLTCERPVELERSLRSIAKNLQLHGGKAAITVYDDSRNLAAEDRTRALCLTLGVSHSGRTQKAERARDLATRAGVSESLVRFALLGDGCVGETMGANRNAILLDSVGHTVLMADDDTAFQGVVPPNHARGIELLDGRDPTELWFFRSREEALDAFARAELDVLGAHEDVLGKSPAEVVRAHDSNVLVSDPSPRLSWDLANPHARIVASLTGVIGDSGHHSGTALLTHTVGGTRERLLASRAAYESALHSREVLRSVPHTTLGRSAALATTVVGLDNTSALPPFPPSQRNEDGVFGLLTRICVPCSYSAWLPPALFHLPTPRTFARGAHLDTANGLRLSEIVIALLTGGTFHGSLGGVGGYLVAIASLGEAAFEEAMRHAAQRLMSRRVAVLTAELEKGGLLEEARADIERYVGLTTKAVTRDEFWLPTDVDASVVDRRSYARRWLKAYGELCLAWPALRSASKLGN